MRLSMKHRHLSGPTETPEPDLSARLPWAGRTAHEPGSPLQSQQPPARSTHAFVGFLSWELGAENILISYCATAATVAIDRLGQGSCRCKGSGLFAGGDQSLRDCLDDLLMYFLDGQVALDQDHTVGLPLSNLAVFFPNAAKESVLLLLETAFV